MCTVVLLRRPAHPWPLVLAANRDEMRDRPSRPPARHWPDRPAVVAGLDELAGGTWMGINDHGVVAAVLNRHGTLGPQPDKRSRGELVLEALDHADAADAAQALVHLDGRAYRGFNLVIADNRDAFWLRSTDGGNGRVAIRPLPEGLSLLTHGDLDDMSEPRIAQARPRFAAAVPPEPATPGGWDAWAALLASRDSGASPDARAALCFMTERGFGTVSSSLLALPAPGVVPPGRPCGGARWLYADGAPDRAPYQAVFASSDATPSA